MSARRDISVGRVIDRALASFRALAAPAILIMLLLSALPEMGAAWAINQGRITTIWATILQLLLWVPLLLAQATIIHAAQQRQAGRDTPFLQSLRAAGERFAYVLVISILTGIGVIIGLIFLVVPGVYLAVLWCVAIPAQMSRREGVLDAINESGDLTEGRRWKVLAACVIGVVVSAVPSVVIYILNVQDQLNSTFVDVILSPLVNTVSHLVTAFGAAALYHELRWRDGGQSEDSTAAVFD
ncbi:hypothetical protein GVN21_05570 [Caulobacter sp. SLTY]|uniref:hypothetical protein n=1 Tax=Caulobacter sp. SLTY TaxID=2683262 RepID=UPI001412EEEE|nr:hypothetical protein [Caulobacter sp. SLTY]NBB14833.1 hypothetical protein [Caulobacter sp. SLTY]